jgi:pimeloyl-ACP methyl ester carboxylesterase
MTLPRWWRLLLRITAMVATTVLVLGSCTTTATTGTGSPEGDRPEEGAEPAAGEPTTDLEWSTCDGRYECAEVEVPVDHDVPDGDTIAIALIRRPATDPDRRIGSLLVNPGGPGGSGVDAVAFLSLPAEVAERFDVVGFDPRGVGRSAPLDCNTHLQAIYDVDPTLDDRADRRAFLDVSQDFVDECEERHGDLLAHLGTEDVARDLDLIRAAVGDEQLSYLGYSYGTSIGQQYARLFPEKVRTMVLDGVVDVSRTGLENAAGQAEGFSSALDSFIDACDSRGCGLDQPAGDAVDAVIAAAEQTPIPAPGADRPATPGVVALALAQPLYAPSLWPQLGRALDEALDGDATGLVRLADEYLDRDGDGRYGNGFEVYFAVNCLDSAWPDEPDAVFDAAADVGEEFPRLGEALVNDYARCPLWPVDPSPLEPVPSDIEGLDPIVLVSTTGDPATPHHSALAVADQIPASALVSFEGEGHTIYGQGNACVDDAVTAYLVEGTVPDDDLTCR